MAKPPNRIPSKIRPVPIALMRVPPALITQREFRPQHANEIGVNFDPNKLGYPTINHRDKIYWILDGQHRIAGMKLWADSIGLSLADQTIDCEVYEDLDDAAAAEIFLGRDARKAISPFDKFHVACTAGRDLETKTRRIVEANGLKISRESKEGCLGSVSTLVKICDRSGEVVLGQVLRTVKAAFDGDSSSFDRSLLEALGLTYNRYNGRTNEKEMAARLSTVPQGVRGILRRAEAQRERTGNQKAQCVAATIVDIYNRGKGAHAKDRLAPWWKQHDEAGK